MAPVYAAIQNSPLHSHNARMHTHAAADVKVLAFRPCDFSLYTYTICQNMAALLTMRKHLR